MSAVYALKYKTRVCEPQKGSEDKIRFLFGTCSVTEENQVHLVEFSDDDEEVFCVNVFPHLPEVQALASSPSDPALLASSYPLLASSSLHYRLALWRMAGDDMHSQLDRLAELSLQGPIAALLWEESAPRSLFTATPGHFTAWDIDSSAASLQIPLGEPLVHVGGASLNPHFSTVVAVCVGDSILGFDTREAASAKGTPAWKILAAAEHVRDVDFNPNRPYFLCSGGDEGRLCFWDYRKPQERVEQSFLSHTHWISSVEYNPHHDSLVLSSGTDGQVNLYNAKSVSSAPPAASGTGGGNGGGDYLVSTYDQFSQSVYQARWSSSDAWVYAAVSYDGKALIETVPDKEKMQILL